MLSSHFSRFCNAGELVHSVEKKTHLFRMYKPIVQEYEDSCNTAILEVWLHKKLRWNRHCTYARHECQKHGNFNRDISVNANKYPDRFNLGRDTQFVVVQWSFNTTLNVYQTKEWHLEVNRTKYVLFFNSALKCKCEQRTYLNFMQCWPESP